MNSGLLPHRIASGARRSATIFSNSRVTRRLAKLVSSSSTGHSRAYRSITPARETCFRSPPRHAQNPTPTPGSVRSAAVSKRLLATNGFGSFAESTAPLPGTLDPPACEPLQKQLSCKEVHAGNTARGARRTSFISVGRVGRAVEIDIYQSTFPTNTPYNQELEHCKCLVPKMKA